MILILIMEHKIDQVSQNVGQNEASGWILKQKNKMRSDSLSTTMATQWYRTLQNPVDSLSFQYLFKSVTILLNEVRQSYSGSAGWQHCVA